jgi:protease-4
MWHKIWQKLSKTFRSSFGVISVITLIIVWSVISYFGISYGTKLFSNSTDANNPDTSVTSTAETSDCNVEGITLHGSVVTYDSHDSYNDQNKLIYDQTSADEVVWYVRDAQSKDNIKAIAVEIDSSGGSPVGGEEMMRAFKDSKKPVVAFIRNVGASAAYLAATGAQTIFASQFSDVGSIGVTMSYLQEVNKNTKDGLTYVNLSSGPYKDSGNPARLLTDAEKQLFMRDVNISYNYFVQLVAQNRNLSIDKVKALADGSSVEGEMALKDGII